MSATAATTPGFGVRSADATCALPTIAFLGGTGRMGVHLCAAWANAGYDVTMCSRTKDKAQAIVDSLLSGKGYQEKASSGSSGEISVPPCPAEGWKLKAGTNEDAALGCLSNPTGYHSPLTTHHSPLTTHRSPLTFHPDPHPESDFA